MKEAKKEASFIQAKVYLERGVATNALSRGDPLAPLLSGERGKLCYVCLGFLDSF